MLPTIIHRAPSRRRGDFDFDRLFNGLLDLDRANRSAAAADLYETEEGYGLELELPGFRESEIDVTVDRGVLTISGARSEVEADEGRTYHVRERRNERFTRSFSLPASIRGEDVAAHLNAGVLTGRAAEVARGEAAPRRGRRREVAASARRPQPRARPTQRRAGVSPRPSAFYGRVSPRRPGAGSAPAGAGLSPG